MAGPFFIPDLSSWEGNSPNFDAIAADSRMVGCLIKSSQGLGPGVRPDLGHSLTWFKDNWPRVAAAGGSRYGTSWFRGLYHYASTAATGAAQADYVLQTVERAGGWAFGDLPPAWDLEGAEWTSRQQIVDISSQFAERIRSRYGRAPILYTGSIWRKFGVTDAAGFASIWTTHMDLMAPFGWPNDKVILHQYVGDGKYWNPSSTPAKLGYPTSVLGLSAKVDMNVVMDGGTPATSIERVRAVLTSGRPGAAERGGVSTPLLIGAAAGLAALGLMIASVGRDELA
ncbi:MAG TPA: GH25 family lysozyme [Gaiellaceae bacterium]|nr:GH25 family lysozyme [Gaiellaceae bacterium]